MASNHIARVTAGGKTNATIAPSIYGYCTTPGGTAAKVVTMYSTGSTAGADWAAADLFHGLTIFVRFQDANWAANPTLNVNNTGAKPIYRYGTIVPSTNSSGSWNAQSIISFTYDTLLNTSGCWVMHNWLNDNTFTTVYCETSASTAAKVGVLTNTSWANTSQPRLTMINFNYDNIAASALTLNVASHGAKPIYINGQPSSSTNYSLPHGTYLGYFDGTNWYINTDGTIPQQATNEVLIATDTTAATINTKIWIEI